jgi:hypothetical protein
MTRNHDAISRSPIRIQPTLDARMENWALWTIRELDGSRGYPLNGGGGLLQRMMQGSAGGYSHRDSYAELGEEAQDAIAIESLLLDMERFEEFSRTAAVVRERYIGQGVNSEKAVRLGMSLRTFQTRLDQGLVWLCGALANEAIMRSAQGQKKDV